MFEKGHVMPDILPQLPMWSPHEEEQMIVFEMEMIAPVCLFPLVLPIASVSMDGITSHDDDDLATDAVPILLDAPPTTLDAKDGTIGFGEDARLGPNTAPDDPSTHLHLYKQHSSDDPNPFVSHRAFHNTVDMLPPATGLPVSHLQSSKHRSLLDHGANGSIARIDTMSDFNDHAVALPTSC